MTHFRKGYLIAIALIPMPSTFGMSSMMAEPVSAIFMPFSIGYCLSTQGADSCALLTFSHIQYFGVIGLTLD